jgi:RNA polymerase sigma-70 factor (ECF subfamily)
VESATDGELIRRSLDDPELFEGIFDRHYDLVRIYVQRRLGHDDGEEVAASAFEWAFAHRHRFNDVSFSSAKPWLIGIANNLIRRHLRRQEVRRRHWPISIVLDRADPEPSLDGLVALEQRPALRDALESLSRNDRETFLLVVLAELPYQEVAETLGVPLGTVRSRVNRARGHLRELLGSAEAINPWNEDSGEPDG